MTQAELEARPSPEARIGTGSTGGVWTALAVWFLLGAGASLALSALLGLLEPVLGATHAARGALLAAAFGAACAGSWRAARGSGRGGLFLAVCAAYQVIAPWWIPALAPLAGLGWKAGQSSVPALFLIRFALALLGLGVPSACLGAAFTALATTPDGVRCDRRSEALRLAILAAGAMLGVVQGSQRFLPWGGEASLAIAGALGLLVTAILSRFVQRGAAPTAGAQRSGRPVETPALLWDPRWIGGLTATAAILSWERILALVMGPFPETASVAPGLFLAGVALGALCVALAPPRTESSPLRAPAIAALTGVAVAVTAWRIDQLPLLYLSVAPTAASAPFRFRLGTWGLAALLVLPASVGWGAWLSMCSVPGGGGGTGEDARARRDRGVAGVLAGAFLGAVLVPVGLVPVFGFRRTLIAVAALVVASSAAAFAFAREAPKSLRVIGILAAGALVLVIASRPLPGTVSLLASGVHRYATEIRDRFKDPAAYRMERLDARISFYREGGEATAAVERVEVPGDVLLTLTQDGAVVGTTSVDLVPQVLSVEIPLVLRPSTREVFLAGYGTGIGVGSALLHPITRLDVVELEPALVEGSKQFEPVNRVPRKDPRLRLLTDDPRQVLQSRGPGAYDLILLRPASPEAAPARFLTTRRFYALCASRLRPGGLFAQAVPLDGITATELASILRTVATAFKDVVLFQSYYQEALILASDEVIRFNPDRMQQVMEDAKIHSDLGRIGVADPDSILIRHRLSGRGLAAFSRSGRILADEGAPLTWEGFRPGASPAAEATLAAVDRFSTGLSDRLEGLASGEEGTRRLRRLARAAVAAADAVRAADLAEGLLARGDAADGHQILGDAHYLRREHIAAVEEWHKALEADPRHLNTLLSLADYGSDRQNWEGAERYLRRALEVSPADSEIRYLRGRALYHLKRYPESEADLTKALAAQGESRAPLALYYLGLIQKEKKNLSGAAEFLRRYLQWAYRQGRLTAVEADVHLALAEVYAGMKLQDLAEQQKRAGEVLRDRLREKSAAKRKELLEWLRKP